MSAALASDVRREPDSFSAVLVRALVGVGIRNGFGVPGADINPFLAACECASGFTMCFAGHETMAAAMADAFWRRSGRFALAAACGGPGAANLVAGAWSIATEGTPVLLVTGAPPRASRTAHQPGGAPMDVRAFEALGIISIQTDLLTPDALAEIVVDHLSRGEPVHVQLPLCVGRSTVVTTGSGLRAMGKPVEREVRLPQVRPRLVFGVGAHAVAQAPEIRKVAEDHGVPVVTDMLARGLVDERIALAFGHAGFMADPRVMAIADPVHPLAAEQVVLLGATASLRRIFALRPIVLDACVEQGLRAVTRSLAEAPPKTRQTRDAWVGDVLGLARYYTHSPPVDGNLDYAIIMESITETAESTTVFVIDAGHFHLLATMQVRAARPRTVITQSALVAMGWSCGAAIGASFADPTTRVVALLGDGCFAMHGLELATAVRYRANITYVIAWNGVYGTVARGYGAVAMLAVNDPAAVVTACGMPCVTCATVNEFREAFQRASTASGPQAIVARVPATDDTVLGHPTGVDWLDGSVR